MRFPVRLFSGFFALALLVASAISLVFAVTSVRVAGDATFQTPRNMTTVTLFDDVLATADSMPAAGAINKGAYNLLGPGDLPIRGFRLYARPGCVVNGDSVWVRIAFLRDSTVTDTVSYSDSLRLSASGNVGKYYAVADSGYRAVLFSFINYAGVSRAIKKSVFFQKVDY